MSTRPGTARWLGETNDVTKTFLAAGQIPDLINLAGGLPDPSTWPVAELSALAGQVIADSPNETLGYGPVEGLPALRDLIARRFSTDQLHLTRDNVLITTAGMQALSLVGMALVDTGQVIAAQSPAYLGALDAWRPRHPTYRPMHLDAADYGPVAALSGAQFGYVVPNFSNPTGRLVRQKMRQRLVDAAIRTGCWLVEDDPYGTLYYDSPPLPRLLDLAGAAAPGPYTGPVVYLGTLSKELAPGLRIGWVIAAPEMIGALAISKQGGDMCTPGVSQMIALRALEAGLDEAARPGILSLYRDRRDALVAAMDRHLTGLFDWQKPAGGMFVWARASDPALDTDRLMTVGLDHGVCVSPSSVFDPEGGDTGAIRINFTLNDPAKLAEGIERLARAARATLAERRGAA